jgi:glucose/arabinose dehydrogenase
MGRLFRTTIVIALAAVAACDDSRAPSSPPPSSGSETVTGRERVSWIQQAERPEDLSTYQYAAYVDDVRRPLESVICGPGPSGSADCSAPLPQLAPGRHTLQIVAFFMAGNTPIEGPRSPSLTLTVAGITAPPADTVPESGPIASSDGLQMMADILARDLDDPVDLAVGPAHRVYVAERAGRVRAIEREAIQRRESQSVVIGRDEDDARLLSLTLAADFGHSRVAYVAYAASDRGRPAVRVARLREAGGQFAQRAVIASMPVTAADTSAIVRLGPDGALYIGVAAGPNPDDAQRLASPEGKVLRLNADGSTPDDNPAKSPVYSYGHRDPRGLAWHADGTLWETERGETGDEMNVLRAGGNFGWPVAMSPADPVEARRRWTSPRVALPDGTDTTGLVTINMATHPLHGDLIVSARGARDLLRIRLTGDRRSASAPPSQLLQGRFGRIAQVTAAPDGTLYFITANRDTWGPASDMLVRVTLR